MSMTPTWLWKQRRKVEIRKKVIHVAKEVRVVSIMAICLLLGASPWIVEKVQAVECEKVDENFGAENLVIIESVCNEYGISPELVEAIGFYESSGNPNVSNGTCIGMFQVDYRYSEYTEKELYVVRNNVDACCNELIGLFEEYDGDLDVVLCAYNCGRYSKTVQNLISGKISNWKYSDKVMALSERLEEEHGKKDYFEYLNANAKG